MTDPPHTFMVYAHPSNSGTQVVAKLRLMSNCRLGQASEEHFRWDRNGDCRRIVEFVALKREPSEPAVFDILRDLFPTKWEALDLVECEMLMKPILEAAEAQEERNARR